MTEFHLLRPRRCNRKCTTKDDWFIQTIRWGPFIYWEICGQRPPKPEEGLALQSLYKRRSPPTLKLRRAKVGPAGIEPATPWLWVR